MDVESLGNLASQLTDLSQKANELLFWRANPEIATIFVNVTSEYNDQGGFYSSRAIADITFNSEEARVAFLTRFLRSIGISEEDVPAELESLKLNSYLELIDEYVSFTATTARCDSDKEYARPQDDLDLALVQVKHEAKSVLLESLRGESVFALVAPNVDYDDEYYSVSGEGCLSGIYAKREDAEARCYEQNCAFMGMYSAREADPDNEEWWGDEDPDECDDIDQRLSIWEEGKPELLSSVEEVTLQ